MRAVAALLVAWIPAIGGVNWCQPIVIQHSQVSNVDQSNYVLTISDTDPHLATVANGGYVQNSNGYDIVFASDSQGQNLLNWEPFEVYNPSTGQIVTHVAVGTISHLTDNTIYRCAGSTATTFQGGSASVWPSSYVGVYHMGSGVSLSAADASASANNGTIAGATAVAGKIGGAASITGATDHILLPEDLGFPLSIEAWVKVTALTGTQVIAHIPGTYNETFLFIESTGRVEAYFGGSCALTGSSVFPSAGWQHIAVTYAGQGGVCALYINGSQIATGTMIGQAQGGLAPAVLGSAGSTYALAGSLDEVRLYAGVLSAPRIATDYNNQAAPGTFYVPGSWATAHTAKPGSAETFIF